MFGHCEYSNNLRMSFLLALINDHRVSAGDKIADIIGPGPKQLRHAGSLRQNEHACILDGRGLGHCWVIVVYVLGSGATLGLADARGYRCRNKGNVVVRCGDYRPWGGYTKVSLVGQAQPLRSHGSNSKLGKAGLEPTHG